MGHTQKETDPRWHAAVPVAVGPEEVEEHGGLKEAVAFNMAPYEETGTLFREGTRWDWEIGGRYTGHLLGEDVVPVGELRRRLPELLAADGVFPPCRAFLHRRNWHERTRLGWVAADHPTECEERGHEARRCKFRHHATEAIIVTWNEAPEVWQPKFWERFVSRCRDDEVAVVVDFHISTK